MIPVIMSGGNGTRLWPRSRKHYPKQFLLFVSDNSMFQDTVLRLNYLNIKDPVIVCNEAHRFIVAEHLRQIKKNYNHIILEPFSKNSASAIALVIF